MKRVATLATIAEALGLTTATVSMALRSMPKIPEKTRLRVTAEAARQGYQRNVLVSTRMAKVRGAGDGHTIPAVAYVTGYPQELHAANPFLQATLRGLRRRTAELGFPLRVFYGAGRVIPWDDLERELERRHVLGVILGDFLQTREEARLDWSRYALVAIGHSVRRPAMHTVHEENLARTLTALRQAQSRGTVRIGFMTSRPHEERFSDAITAAYLAWQAGRPRQEHIPVFRFRPQSDDTARLAAWLKGHRMDLILSGLSAENPLSRIPARRRPPVLYLSRTPTTEDSAELRRLAKPDFEIGVASMDLLADLMYRHETGLPAQPFELQIPPATRASGRPRSAPSARAPSRPVTLRDLAKRLRLSLSTVSLAMRGDRRVAEDTKALVRQTARKMGFRHNPLLTAWAGQFHETHRRTDWLVAQVVGYPQEILHQHLRWGPLGERIRERMEKMHARLETLHLGPDDAETGRVQRLLRSHNVDAILWGPFPSDHPAPPMEWSRDFVIVGIGRSPATRNLHRVVHNRYLGLRRLLRELAAQGHRRPGLAGGGPGGEPSIYGWLPAFLHATESRTTASRNAWLPLTNPDRQSFRRWLESYRPDVILSPFHELRRSARGTRFIALEPDPDHLPAATDALLYPSASMADRALDLLIMSADQNQFGPPPHPTDTAIPGEFRRARARREPPSAGTMHLHHSCH